MNRLVIASMFAVAAVASHANTVVFVGAGSSAMFNQFEQAARVTASVGLTHNYRKAGAGRLIDGSNPTQSGDLWVVWQGDTAGSRNIWAYISLDSTVGVRAYFNSAQLGVGTQTLATMNTGITSGYAALPADVYNTLATNPVVNAGMTDITPADALIATQRSFDQGYSGSNPIQGFGSSGLTFSSTVPASFSLSARPFGLFSIGAAPVLVVVNTTDATVSGLGQASNINGQTLSGFLDGTFKRTSSLLTDAAARNTNKPVVTWLREGLSGTYVTLEYCVPNTVRFGTTQEANVSTNPLREATRGGNPFSFVTTTVGTSTVVSLTTADTGGRVRGIGTRGVLNGVNNTVNGLGYAFWAVSQFTNVANGQPLWPNLRYLTVDGVDPIQDSYTGGSFPQQATLSNVKNGSYPIWAILRACAPPALLNNPGLFRSTFLTASGLNLGSDVVPKNDLLVFRSYRATAAVPFPSNGIISPTTSPEIGADAGGLVFPINAEFDFFNDTGSTLVNLRQ